MKKEVKLNTLRQLEDMVKNHVTGLGPIMDDYDGGQAAAYEKVLNDINAFRAIVNHVHSDE
jgi:hypothetical protein